MPLRSEVVAIIGGGASGVLTAAHLLRTAPGSMRLVIIEPRAELGEGIAFKSAPALPGCRSPSPTERVTPLTGPRRQRMTLAVSLTG
jgi:cation diffusion facilitator CzcD-associated flavoprotein CzcO